MSSILHRWDDKGVCEFCGVKVLDVNVNGGLFCAGSAEGRKKPDTGTDTPGPAAASGSSGGFGFYGIRPGPAPGAPPPAGGAQGTTSGSASPTPQAQVPQGAHDWDSAGFCKLCKLGMYAVKQLNLPCRPVPHGMQTSFTYLPPGAYGGHLFNMATGNCVNCKYHQTALAHFDCDCASAQHSGVPPMPYAGYPTVAPFTPDQAQDAPAKSPYLIQSAITIPADEVARLGGGNAVAGARLIDELVEAFERDRRAYESFEARRQEGLRLLGFKTDD